jgi:hypothetical protein
MTRIQPMFDGMIADMLALQRDYSDDELAVVLDVITRASEILRAHARRIRRGD